MTESDINRSTRGLVAISIAIAAVNVLIGFIKFMGGRASLPAFLEFFESGDEVTFPTWFSVLILALAGLAAMAACRRLEVRVLRRGMGLLAVVMFYLSLDESAAIHERFNGLMRSVGDFSGVLERPWVIPAVVLVLVVGALFIPFLKGLPKPVIRGYMFAGALYLGGAVGLELVAAAALANQGPSILSDVPSIIEELAEMIAAILVGRISWLVALYGVDRVTPSMIYRPSRHPQPVPELIA